MAHAMRRSAATNTGATANQTGNTTGSDEHARVAKALTDANKRYTLAVLPDAPHAFATFDRDSYHPPAAEAAWRIAFAFLVDTFMQGASAAYS